MIIPGCTARSGDKHATTTTTKIKYRRIKKHASSPSRNAHTHFSGASAGGIKVSTFCCCCGGGYCTKQVPARPPLLYPPLFGPVKKKKKYRGRDGEIERQRERFPPPPIIHCTPPRSSSLYSRLSSASCPGRSRSLLSPTDTFRYLFSNFYCEWRRDRKAAHPEIAVLDLGSLSG